MVPGLAMCPACSQLIQNSHNWQAHHVSIKHQKCSHTLKSIGVTGDYDKPLGAISPGEYYIISLKLFVNFTIC